MFEQLKFSPSLAPHAVDTSIGPFQAIFVALSIVLRPIGRRLTRGLFGRSCFAYHQYYRNKCSQYLEPHSHGLIEAGVVVIGIACQPKDVTCVRRAEEKAK